MNQDETVQHKNKHRRWGRNGKSVSAPVKTINNMSEQNKDMTLFHNTHTYKWIGLLRKRDSRWGSPGKPRVSVELKARRHADQREDSTLLELPVMSCRVRPKAGQGQEQGTTSNEFPGGVLVLLSSWPSVSPSFYRYCRPRFFTDGVTPPDGGLVAMGYC